MHDRSFNPENRPRVTTADLNAVVAAYVPSPPWPHSKSKIRLLFTSSRQLYPSSAVSHVLEVYDRTRPRPPDRACRRYSTLGAQLGGGSTEADTLGKGLELAINQVMIPHNLIFIAFAILTSFLRNTSKRLLKRATLCA
ncbi:uncharacterized protein BBA_07065 [Beauveria bassiana ARSEF 2860]|uniref:Uncharacterized protein n=1 Tax=Beauveria bassiana (strain ARSEF 2860) TaxID=655819 RepID=J4W0K5_BEAB2|nr:uncharacterized protein BBA_07065 [Beauveria bassiana ARSEF 2860]EJP64060.1 hypothetical protein BBA_07065 [Beauveria bassiana ARSEF 2860]